MILLFMLRKTCRLNFTYVLPGLIVFRYIAAKKCMENLFSDETEKKRKKERTYTKEMAENSYEMYVLFGILVG